MFVRIALPLILLLSACAPSADENPNRAPLSAAIDSLLELTVSVAVPPGISLAVVHAGDTIVMKGYGLANVEHQVPVTDRTVFNIASVTKQFTAAAMVKLVEDGKLHLDTTVEEILPDFAGSVGAVTIHQLLNHTSGITNYTSRWEHFGNASSLTRDEMRAVFAEPLQFDPGREFAYTNSGYYLLGLILEAVVFPERFDAHLARTQFQPLGLEQMRRCNQEEIIPHRVQAYTGRLTQLVNFLSFSLNPIGSDGELCGTARDLVLWARALSRGRVVSEESYRSMTSPTRIGSREIPSGYGLHMRNLDGVHPYVWHTGGFFGFSSVLAHYPEEDLTIAVLANGATNLLLLQEQVARLVLGINPSRHTG